MTMSVSICGVFDCESCDHYISARCPGCTEGNEQLSKRSIENCGIFRCVNDLKINACSDCNHTTCQLARRSDTVCPLRERFENRRWWAGRLAKSLAKRNKLADVEQSDKISDRTIDRMRWYLMALEGYSAQGISSISSWQLAQKVGVKAPLIRKDLSRFGEFGTPSFGYDVKYLRRKIMDILHLNESRHIIWLGSQKLKEQLAVVQRMSQHNCHLVAVLDPDPSEVGRRILDLQVLHLDNLAQVLSNLSVDVAVVALVPP